MFGCAVSPCSDVKKKHIGESPKTAGYIQINGKSILIRGIKNMKKKILTTGKKALSLVMVCFMLMSCWVFFAPTANAADVRGIPEFNNGHYRTTDKYGTPVFDGTLDRWFKWQEGDDYTIVYYPSAIYLDKSETLQSAGYFWNVDWHFGSSTDYRILLGANVWGDHSQWSGYPDRYYSMTNAFSSYSVDASLPSGGSLTKGDSGTDSSTYDLRIVGYGYNSDTDKFTQNDTTHNKYIAFRSNGTSDPNTATIYLKGTPTGTGTWDYNTSGSSFGSYGYAQKYSKSWGSYAWREHDARKQFHEKGSDSSYKEGDWIEMQWNITIYDKSALSSLLTTANTIYNNGNANLVSGDWAAFTQARTAAQTTLTTRKTTQDNIDLAKTNLQNAINALNFSAVSNDALKTALASAKAIQAEAGYNDGTKKYTQAMKDALDLAVANAEAGKFANDTAITGTVPTYNAGTYTNANTMAGTDKTTIANLTNALNTAINAMVVNNYLITFKKWDGTTFTDVTKEYPYGTPGANITLPTWTTAPEYDDDKHYTYTHPTSIADVTGAATYTETRTEGAHSFYYDDKTETTHDRKCLNCSRVIDNEPHVKANGKSTEHTCTADGYITYQCGDCGQKFVVSGVILDSAGNEVADPAAHKWSNRLSDIGNGTHGYKCSVCDEYDPNRISNHEFVLGTGDNDIIKAPTCMEEGSGNYYCSCGATKVDTIAKLPYNDAASHVIGNVTSNGDGTHSGKCTVTGCDYESTAVDCTDTDGDGDCKCDYCTYVFACVYNKQVATKEYLATPADCLHAATYYYSCDCGASSKETDSEATFSSGNPLGHDYSEKLVDADHLKDEATCTAAANYWYDCSRCDSISSDKFYASGNPLGHDYTGDVVDNKDGTHSFECKNNCGTTGGTVDCTYGAYTYDNTNHTHVCTVCGHSETKAHTMSDWTTDEGATNDGEATQSRHCTVCAYTENSQKCNYTQTEHIDSTCKATGYTTYTCSDCGHGYTVVHPIESTNHSDYGTKDVTVTPATCTAKGEYKKVCKGCEADIETGLELPIDPNNHGDHATTVEGKVEATCTIKAESGKIICNGCKDTISENVIGDVDITKHVETTKHDGLAPTCTEDGYTEYETCDDPNCPVGTIGKTTLNKLGHEYTGAAVDNENGTHSYKCVRYDACKTIGTTADGENGSVACLDAEPVYTNPECNVDGYWTHTCDTCGYVWTVTNTGSALTHDYSINEARDNVIDFDDEDKHAYYCQNGCGTYGVGEGNDAKDLKEACYGGEATCLDKAVCSVCGKEYGEALGHDFSADAKRINKPEAGKHNYKCSRCEVYGITETDEDGNVTQKLGGTIDCLDAQPVVTNPTCLDGGYTTHICDTCGYTWTTDPVAALGHDYTETKIDTDHLKSVATCEDKATYWYDCSRCTANAKDAEDAATNKDLYFEYGKANGHTFDREEVDETYLKTEATCTENAIYYVSCSVCYKSSALVDGQTKTFAHLGSMLGHQWIDFVDETDLNKYLKESATCETAAVYYKSCERCKISSKDVTGQTATFSYGTKNDHVFTEQIQDSAHRKSVATCIAKAVYYYDCINCKVNAKNLTAEETEKYSAISPLTYEYGDLAPNNHTDLVTVPYKAPICGVAGNNEHKFCNGCQTTIGKVVYDALEHSYTGDYVYDAENNTHKRACVNNCGTYGDSVNCTFGAWTQSKNEEGNEIHTRVCICGNTETELCSGGEADCLNKAVCDTCKKEYGEPKGHSYSDTFEKVEGKDLHRKVCANGCGIDITEACSGGEATCSTLAICDVCKAAYGEYSDHVFVNYVKSAEASCGVNAKETAKCEYCDATDTRDIPDTALKHVMGDYEYTTPPTCKDEGEEKSTCTLGCGYYITRPVPADKNAHIWTEWTEVGGDCASGIIEERECTICGAKEKRTNTENLEHTWVTIASVKPGCEVDGYTKQQCSKCKFVQEITLLATGHSFTGEYTFYSAATCTSAEIWARPCDNKCGKFDFIEKEGTMLPHNYVIWAGSAATCTSDGYTDIYHCTDCGFEEGGAVLPMLDHADKNGDGQCDSCNGKMSDDGSSACSCICHKQNAFMKFIFKIVNFFWKLFKIGKTCDCGAVHW